MGQDARREEALAGAGRLHAHEVRIAVVMYGGTSLAIYMNGIAQELLHLVRATAEPTSEGLSDLERVYRRIGVHVGPDGEWHEGRAGGTAGGAAADGAGAVPDAADPEAPAPEAAAPPVRTKFVIDIISGTSAGGINAVFLARALANRQRLHQLEELWVTEGDIETLIHDRWSRVDELEMPHAPESLLYGDRMFVRLVQALEAMDEAADARPTRGSGGDSRPPGYVDEVDLFVTGTDVVGLDVPLRLADDVARERRHRSMLHFRYSARDGLNDFTRGFTPLLAFAARSTSSIPFVFRPVQLATVEGLARAVGWSPPPGVADAIELWRPHFPDYARDAVPLELRAFVDGGVLNNKPFVHAIDQLIQRRGGPSVERKLFYVEPNPDVAVPNPDEYAVPHAIRNAVLGLTLPGYETIREDLERVLARNRLVARVRTLTLGAEEDLERSGQPRPPSLSGTSFERMFLADLVHHMQLGPSYGGHHRLKVAAVTDTLARIVAGFVEVDEHSDEVVVLREAVRAWRNGEYSLHEDPARDDGVPPRKSEASFLLRFDLSYRVRRLHFVFEQIDAWMHGLAAESLGAGKERKLVRLRGELGVGAGTRIDPEALRALRAELAPPLDALRRANDLLHQFVPAAPGEAPDDETYRLVAELAAYVRHWFRDPSTAQSLASVLGDAPHERRAPGKVHLPRLAKGFGPVADRLAEVVRHATTRAAALSERALADDPADRDGTRLALAVARDSYEDFERYDMTRFPVMEVAGVGEELSHVDVHRISPADAEGPGGAPTSAARRGAADPVDAQKLAGVRYVSFGAFLNRQWREHDILWGRLDGAERLIASLVRDERIRAGLIAEAHAAILREGGEHDGRGGFRPPALEPVSRQVLAASATRAVAVVGRMVQVVSAATERKRLYGLLGLLVAGTGAALHGVVRVGFAVSKVIAGRTRR